MDEAASAVGYGRNSNDTEAMAVSIQGLVKRFGDKTAVDSLSLDIPVGSFYGLVGPNGAGKTTTLNMVTGLLMPDGGTISILGFDVWSDVNRAKRSIGVMPQADQIFNRLTGRQLLIYSGMLRGMKRAEVAKRADDLLRAFDLAEAGDKMVSGYSAGMTKKICLGTAMIASPRILVLDEPFESVDPVSSANLKDVLAEYAATGGTVIISSHVMALVEKMCTHVAVIDHGRVRAAGTVAQVEAGEDLEDRFLYLVGGRHGAAHLDWLDGGGNGAAASSASMVNPAGQANVAGHINPNGHAGSAGQIAPTNFASRDKSGNPAGSSPANPCLANSVNPNPAGPNPEA
ncbi:ABC transporter ATP-binding protein [Bifidobacterium sp. ESL0800]|uniref:ABC transporter ATP-binding protein n=1 Tax=Bifidobacterium sp. ESL0800 TaxID=2983236 RepID=UPI0023F960F1|nr:ABC transporter ATP-binding protein [Bifidobacterium sp. ESL0800]WEV75917.1 ABC transporter ATP-binding protein [Bifidobacterium sp. ESL0800]